MKGRVRPIAIQSRCSLCQKPYEEVPKLGYICRNHFKEDRGPKKFYIDLPYQKKRYRLFTDKHGNILDSYSAATSVLRLINFDIENHTFHISHYLRKEKEKYYLGSRWIEHEKRYHIKKTLDQLAYAKKYIFQHFASSTDIRDITQADILLFAEAIPTLSKKEFISGKSIKNIVWVLLSMLNNDCSHGLRYPRLFAPKIEMQNIVKSIPELAQSLKVISYIEESDRLIFLFLVTHLCRPADARALQARHFNFSKNTVDIELGFSGNQLSTTKTKKPYTIPIHSAIRRKLQELCILKMPNDFVFTHRGKRWGEAKLREVWNKGAAAANLKIKFYNGVKHASISYVASESGDIFNTSKLTGHADVGTTQIYAEKVQMEKLSEIQEMIIIPEDLL